MTTTIPWVVSDADSRFQRLMLIALATALVLSLIVSRIPLPDIKLQPEQERPRFAEIILPEIEPPTPAEVIRPKPKPIEVKPEPIEKKEAVPLEQVVVAEVEQTVKQAREKAKVSGLLAFQDQLKSMREAVDQNNTQDTASLTRGAGEAARVERAMLTSNDRAARRANVNVAELSSETGGVALSGRENTIVEAPEEAVAATGAVRLVKPDTSSVRSIEEIRRVFDANKGAIFSIYNRALRKDPNLLGKVVLELVIEPDGSVSACEILTSELTNEELLTRVTRRVSLFDFGERNVSVTRISYPVHFLPT